MERVAQKSAAQGYPRSRLSDFTEEEIALVRGTSDFFGVNHYSGTYVSSSLYTSQYPVPSTYDDVEVGQYVPDDWTQSASVWLRVSCIFLVQASFEKTSLSDEEGIFYFQHLFMGSAEWVVR